MVIYEYNFNDSLCVSINIIIFMSLLDIIVGFYNDIIKLNLYFEWINKNNIMLLNN